MTEQLTPPVVTQEEHLAALEKYQYGWADSDVAGASAQRGLNEAVVRDISAKKNEPEWMRDLRLKGLRLFGRKPMPVWGADLSGIDFDNIKYFVRSTEKQATSWDELPEDIKNTYDRLGIPEAEKQRLIAGVAAQYECLDARTRVWTANRGQVMIKEIAPGDRVFSYDEANEKFVVAPVRAAAQTDTRQVYEVRVGGRSIKATDNHPFLVLRDERKPGRQRARYARSWVTLGDLRPGDFVAVPRTLPDFGVPYELPPFAAAGYRGDLPVRAPATTNVDLMWLLGLFIGDGNVQSSGRTHRVQLAVPETDTALRAEITRVVDEQFGLRTIAADAYRVVVNSKALVDWLWKLGFHGTSRSKRVPDWVFGLPADQRLALLGGWVDADGYVQPNASGSVVLTCVSAPLIEQAMELAELSGLRVSGPWGFTQPHRHAPDRTGGGFRIGVSGDFERLGCRNPKRLERFGRRRYSHSSSGAHGTTIRAHVNEQLGFARVESITAVDIAPVYDIEVDGPHNFIAEGMVVHNSEVVYHKIREDLEAQGVLFLDTDTALKEHEDLFKEYFGTVIPVGDNKFAALNTAVWSGGSFIYVPPGVHVDIPLQAYFRINTENMGQFERTLIIVDEGAYVHYVEGCTAPIYSSDSLHSAVVEIIVKKNARCRYTTIQNWSNNVYNLVTKRAVAHQGATMEWIDGNIGCLAEGSRVTTRSGPKPIELVTPGEEVLSYDDASGALGWRQVLGKRYSGEQPVREVRLGERRLRVTDNHPFYSFTYDPDRPKKLGRYRLAYVRADQLSQAIVPVTSLDWGTPHKIIRPELVTEFTGSNQYAAQYSAVRERSTRLAVPDETTVDLMWLLGLFTGDGSIDAPTSANGGMRFAKVTFSVPSGDRARQRLVEVMADLMPGVWPTERADGVTVTWNSVELAELFGLNGFVTGAQAKRVPEWVFALPEDQRLAFLAGYLDSDGCAPQGRRGLSIKSVNVELLRDTARLLTSLGYVPRMWTESDRERTVTVLGYESTCRGAYRLEFVPDERILGHVSPALREAAGRQPAYVKPSFRKVGRSSIALPESVQVRPVEVSEHLGVERTWDIEVEGTGNFVSEGFIVHNSKVTMKYPAVYMVGEHAKGEVLSVAMAGEGQHQDAGAKMTHAAPHTSSQIVSKSIARGGGRTSYRGLVQVQEGSHHSKSTVKCDALLVDTISRSDTYPYVDIREDDVAMGHEATVSKVSEDQLFYLMSRGLTEDEAMAMIVRGFIEPIAKELPMEYALELNRLIELQMEGAVG
jgi:Fe-S cluster assembly scaffold protein SufB